MIVTNQNLQNLRTGFQTTFQQGLGKAANVSAPMVTVVNSSTKTETYGFLSDFPIFRKWLGEKRAKSLRERAYQLVNEDYEVTVTIHKHQIEDDSLGLYGPMLSGIGEDAANMRDRLVFDALKAGNVTVCYDGQYFFDTDHVVNGVTISNNNTANAVQPWYLLDLSKPLKPILFQNRKAPIFVSNVNSGGMNDHLFDTGEYKFGGEARAGVGYTYPQLAYRSTATLNAANYKLAKEAMASWIDDNGEPLGIVPTHIVVGTSNEVAARELFAKSALAGGEGNIYDKELIIIKAPRLP